MITTIFYGSASAQGPASGMWQQAGGDNVCMLAFEGLLCAVQSDCDGCHHLPILLLTQGGASMNGSICPCGVHLHAQ